MLKSLNRQHTANDVKKAITMLKSVGIDNISVDLIYGLPNQTLALWKETLNDVMKLEIPHISLYALTIEEHSQFGRDGIQMMDSELEADLYEYAIQFLEANGYEQYEISNFALPNYASKHNIGYWKYEDFYGIGCGASGKEQHVRYDNEWNIQNYLEGKRHQEQTFLTKKDEQFEFLMMGLRMAEGISKQVFEKQFHLAFDDCYRRQVTKLVERKWSVSYTHLSILVKIYCQKIFKLPVYYFIAMYLKMSDR